jgi:hypothetical protein
VLAALLGAMLASHGLLFWSGWRLARQGYADFTIFYTAGKIVRLGQGHHLYDDALQYQVQQGFASRVRIRKGPLPYNHPAFEALIFVPLTGMDYATAYVVWDLINLGMLGLLPFILRRHVSIMQRGSPLLWFLVLLAFFPVLAALMQGQDVILLFLLYSLAFVAFRKNDDIASGWWLGLCTFKFQLVIPLIVILLCWKRSKAVQSFLVTSAGLAVISVAITGWAEALRYPGYVLHLEKVMGRGSIAPAVMPNLRGLLQGWRTARAFPLATQAIVIALSLGVLLWVIAAGRGQEESGREFDLRFSLATVATVVISYHAFAFDLILLFIPVLLLIGYARETGKLRFGGKMLVRNMALLLPVGVVFCTPLYVLLGFRSDHLNLFALAWLLWLWGIRREMATASGAGEAHAS